MFVTLSLRDIVLFFAFGATIAAVVVCDCEVVADAFVDWAIPDWYVPLGLGT